MGVSTTITNVHGYHEVKDMVVGLINGLCTLLYDLNANDTAQRWDANTMEKQIENEYRPFVGRSMLLSDRKSNA